MRLFKHFIAIIIIILIAYSSMEAQRLSNPLLPAKQPTPDYLGLTFGLGQNFQTGSMLVTCPDCVFEGGVGSGYTLGAYYSSYLSDLFRWGFMVLYDDLSIQSKFVEYEPFQYNDEVTQETEYIPVQFRHTANVAYSVISGNPFIEMNPTKFFFARIGVSGGIPLKTTIKHDKELLTKKSVLSNGTEVNVRIEGKSTYTETVEDSTMRDVNKFQLGMLGMLGFKIKFTDKVFLNSYFMYRIPFSEASTFGDSFKLNSWRIMIDLEYKY